MKIKRKIYECKSEMCVCLIKGDYDIFMVLSWCMRKLKLSSLVGCQDIDLFY